MGTGLYIHVPFCRRKCPYCDFYSVIYSDSAAEEYVKAIIRNFKHYNQQFGEIIIDTIYFGGGTPSLLSAQMLGEILESACGMFALADPEISLEANPCTVTLEGLKSLKHAGFNRISLGVQSLCDNELNALGRLHDSRTAVNAVVNAQAAGFKNISADLMMGIIEQDLYSLDNSIQVLSKLPLTHISAYMLKIEKGTAYDSPGIYERIPDDDNVSDMYLYVVDKLKKMGFEQYEISNFSKKGYECRHNLHYWRCEEYIGIGPSSHSFFDGKRYAVPKSVSDFIENEFQTEYVTESNPAGFSEYAMLQIRLSEGLDLAFCKEKYSINSEKILDKCNILLKNGMIKINGSNICLTPKGCLISNRIIGHLFI